ncbi:uncharacterized protein LOC135209100 isoform X2 [Macrobrachium nipponense]|uniref:uncharacterized protein LOC135209100 isoform X2 n=1 Tax=Macrobrachium nipponense TaxID=159736 RepID=UPI0030C87A78
MRRITALMTLLVAAASSATRTEDTEHPCKVMRVDADVENSTLSVTYNTTVVDRKACGDADPICNISRDSGRSYAILKDAVNGRDLKDIDHIEHRGKVTYCHNEKVQIKCGSVLSKVVQIPKVSMIEAVVMHLFNDTHLVLRLKPLEQVRDYRVEIYQRYPRRLLAKADRVPPATDVTLLGNYTNQEIVYVKFYADLFAEDEICPAAFTMELDKGSAPEQVPVQPTTPVHLYAIAASVVAVGIVAVAILWARKKKHYSVNKTQASTPVNLNIKSVLVVHTKESPGISLEVDKLIGEFKDTGIKKVYDICNISDQSILPNAEPWLLGHFSGPHASSSAVILVCSPGLPKLAQSLKEGKSDAEAICVLGRRYMPSDSLLLSFIRNLFDSRIVWEYGRFFPVWFENIGDTTGIREWQKQMARATLPNIGRSVLFCLPSHIGFLKGTLEGGRPGAPPKHLRKSGGSLLGAQVWRQKE